MAGPLPPPWTIEETDASFILLFNHFGFGNSARHKISAFSRSTGSTAPACEHGKTGLATDRGSRCPSAC